MAWRPPEADYRLGELVLVPVDLDARCPVRLAEHVTAAGYRTLDGADGWQHFRPLSTWRQGIARHARLRDQSLHLRITRDDHGPRVQLVGLLTAALERRLANLGTLHCR